MAQDIDQDVIAAYERMLRSAQLVQHEQPGLVLLSGRDRLDLLQRMSTNDLRDLTPGSWRRTVLTNALARVVDVVQVFARHADVLLLTSPGQAQAVSSWLSGYIFFQDDVQVSQWNEPAAHWGVYGPRARGLLAELGWDDIPGPEAAFCETVEGLCWQVPAPGPGSLQLLLFDEAGQRASRSWPQDRGAAARRAFEILRIESVIPWPGHEITPETIPLEIGLWDEVSFSKGCYIGQEILARMESRGQLARQLVLVGFSERLEPGSRLRAAGRVVGQLSSVAQSPRLGWIGLALLKVGALEAQTLQAGEARLLAQILEAPKTMRRTPSPPRS